MLLYNSEWKGKVNLTGLAREADPVGIAGKETEMLPMTPEDGAEARVQRQAYIGILQRCRELEEEALEAIRPAAEALDR